MALSMFKISMIDIASPQASIEFTSIPQGYTDLKVVYGMRTNRVNVGDHVLMQPNGSSSSLVGKRLVGNGNVAASYSMTSGPAGECTSANCPTDAFGNSEIYIPNYTNATNKTWVAYGTSENTAQDCVLEFDAGTWSNTAAITSLKFLPEVGTAFLAGSTATLYGIK